MAKDIYDGNAWKEFQITNGKTFGLMLNVDYFQAYQHVGHSVGVVYLSIMNLPRKDRFKEENMIVICLIQDSMHLYCRHL